MLNAEELISTCWYWERKLPDVINNSFPNTRPLLLTNEQLMFYINQFTYDAIMQASKPATNGRNLLTLPVGFRRRSSADRHFRWRKFLFTAYDPLKSGEIYIARKINGKWTPCWSWMITSILFLMKPMPASRPTDRHYIYCDRKGGLWLDIYKSELVEATGARQ